MDKEIFSGFHPLDAMSEVIGNGPSAQGNSKSTIQDTGIVDPSVITGDVDEYGNELDEDGNPIPPQKPINTKPPTSNKEQGDGGEPIVDPSKFLGEGDDNDDDDDDDLDGPDNGDDADEDNPPVSKKKKKAAKTDDEPENIFGEEEPELAEYMQEQLFERFGLDIDEDTKKFESLDDITDFVYDAIEERSIPEFANPEVAAIDKYVRDGGRLEDYMGAVHTGVNLNEVNIEDENTQKALVREDLKNQGMTDARIKRRIERMEDNGILAEEAEDALEAITEYRERASEKLLQDQESARKAQEKANAKYFRSVQNELKNTNEILGVKFTDKAKRDTYNYIFTPDEDGVTPMNRAMNSSVKSLLETAFFLQNGGKLGQAIEKKAASSAAKKLKDKLANNKKRGRNQTTSSTSDSDDEIWGKLSRQLRTF